MRSMFTINLCSTNAFVILSSDCDFGWSLWSSCSSSCGPGREVRAAQCANDRKLGGTGAGCPCVGENTGEPNVDVQSCIVETCGT